MKKIFLLGTLLTAFFCRGQWDDRWGITAGVNEYYLGADFVFSKSGTGFSIGIVNTVPISEHSEVLLELTFTKHNFELMGREDILSDPQWLKFGVQRINLAAIYDYDIFHFLDEDLALGLCAGPTVAFYNDMKIKDTSKDLYLLDPYYMETPYMHIDEGSGKLSINVFASFGATARYRNAEASLRYNLGVTDPYRNFPAASPYVEFKGKDSYLSFQVTYYFGDSF